ncbi:MAG: hypothetical protein WBL43_17730 [Pseudolabrys sp.]
MAITPDFVNALEAKGAMDPASHQPRAVDANGNRAAGVVMSRKTGSRARVGVAYAARFQAYIDDLEANYGARVLFMGGIRTCQLRRGVVDRRCNLPGRVTLG